MSRAGQPPGLHRGRCPHGEIWLSLPFHKLLCRLEVRTNGGTCGSNRRSMRSTPNAEMYFGLKHFARASAGTRRSRCFQSDGLLRGCEEERSCGRDQVVADSRHTANLESKILQKHDQ